MLVVFLRARRFWIGAFCLYAAALFAATHWPNLTIDTTVIQRSDLLIHFVSFGAWTLLLALTGLCGPIDRWSSLARVAPIALAYAAFDESTQALPFVHRTFALDDMLANFIGVTIGLLIAAVLCMSVRRARLAHGRPA